MTMTTVAMTHKLSRKYIRVTTSLRKISQSTTGKKLVIVQGGARAGKTFAILLILIDIALTYRNLRIGIFSHSYPHLRRGVIHDFIFIMQSLQRYNEEQFNRSVNVYRFSSGSVFEFITTDKIASLYGTQFDISFVNEAIYVNREAFNRIMLTSKKVFVDFNPTKRFYIHDYIGRDDTSFLKLTYKDNEGCPRAIVKEMQRIKQLAATDTYWRNYYRIYGEGEIGYSIDSVYPNWKYVDKLPVNAKLVCVGVDFGYTNDVTAIVSVYYIDGVYYVNEEVYKKSLLTDGIADILKTFNCPIYCDSAEPRLITELRLKLRRQNIHGVKYKLNESIDYVSQQEISVLINSKNIIKEHQNYVYIRDKFTGELTNTPVNDNNHAMDAIRYAIVGMHERQFKGRYVSNF